MRALAVVAAVCAFGAVLTDRAIAPAYAQNTCHTVRVVEVKQRRVELFDLQANYVTTMSRDELGAITVARECASTPSYLGIQAQGQRWLVRRTALELENAELERPVCAPGQYASQAARNASSSGVGGAGCRPN
jgi:hypothetical protein